MLASLARFIIDMETKYRLFIHLDHDELSEPSSQQFSLKNWLEFVSNILGAFGIHPVFHFLEYVWRTKSRYLPVFRFLE